MGDTRRPDSKAERRPLGAGVQPLRPEAASHVPLRAACCLQGSEQDSVHSATARLHVPTDDGCSVRRRLTANDIHAQARV